MHVALGIEYKGTSYKGFQRQKEEISVQGELEKALSKIAAEPIETFCAGRTDAKVHATGQVVDFFTNSERPIQAWVIGTNANLPRDISVTWAKEVSDNFHSRFSATARRYRYVILNNRSRPGICNGLISHYYNAYLDDVAMNQAAQCLVGEHDFTTFRGAGCQSRTPMRNVHRVFVTRIGDYVIIDITANAFLLHMVRNIVGSLVEIGYGRKPISWLQEIFEAKNRNLAGATAQPDGLYLVDVTYPCIYEIPKPTNLGPFLLV
ncbi:MAG: tRNA pseudouridine(38-40) synthase TruA [Succinivibrionaceae bacterium]